MGAMKNDNKSNPIESLALEVSKGINFLAAKMIEISGIAIQFIIESISKEKNTARKNNVSTKINFKK